MKKTFTLALVFIFFGLSVWAEDNVDLVKSSGVSVVTLAFSEATDDSSGVILEDVEAVIDYGSNDFVEDNLFFEEIVTPPLYGTIGEEAYPYIHYTPFSGYYTRKTSSPVDSFQYSIEYASGTLDSAWVYINHIQGVNDVPTAMRDSFMIVQDSGSIYADVLVNDTDGDRAGLQVKVFQNVKHGRLAFDSGVFRYGSDYLFFPNDGTSPSNKNLAVSFDKRDMSYMDDVVFVYTPDPDFYGYDSLQYIIHEYRPSDLTFFQKTAYLYTSEDDADTATVVFYVEAHDYVPTAVNDVMYKSLSIPMQESDERSMYNFFPLTNDLDADTVTNKPSEMFDISYIIADKKDSATATADDDTLFFYHDVAVYDTLNHTIVYRKDSNMAVLKEDTVEYTYAPDYFGVDSMFYQVVERKLVASDYPERYRGDSSSLAIVYFVVAPVNDGTLSWPDTLDYDFSKMELKANVAYSQFVDVLANDIDLDTAGESILPTLKRLLGSDYDPEFETFGLPLLYDESNPPLGNGLLLDTKVEPSVGNARLFGNAIYYQYMPPYTNELLIDSFKYNIYDDGAEVVSEWAYIRHQAVVANDDIKPVSISSLMINKVDSTLASNLLLTSNDVSSDTVFILYNEDGTLKTPSKSDYATILKPASGEAAYYFHAGFTTIDSFQYIISSIMTQDTGWVYVTNEPCVAHDDIWVVDEDPFSAGPAGLYVDINVLDNDVDAEEQKYVTPVEGVPDTTHNGIVYFEESSSSDMFTYRFLKSFFYLDSFAYVLSDVPPYFAADNFFTKDTAWVYVVDSSFLIDSDGDGIVNTLEDGIPGFQLYEDTLDDDEDSTVNYRDVDSDDDGLRDGGDCDGDGIMNYLDDTPGCDEIEVATAFTPNGDGVNDLFVIPEIILADGSVMPAVMRIYNRMGSLLYENEHYGKDGDWWNGTLGDIQGLSYGDELPEGVYLYYMTYNKGRFKKESYVHIER